MMLWVIFYLILGTVWSWQALVEYYSLDRGHMTLVWQVFNMLLNTLFMPFGLISGSFIIFNFRQEESEEGQNYDLDFTFLKLTTRYDRLERDLGDDKEN